MNKKVSLAAFVLGLAAVVWVGAGYIGTHSLAFLMTSLIAVVYVIGALELRRFHQVTTSLAHALVTVSADLPNLDGWFSRLPVSLHNAVRLRIEGERVALPAPALTPYLVGLLVLLGMLGTFLGMVVTLNGAVLALESTTDLETIRASLAAPVKGLGVAFGTSVAGVAASAMLGLISALARRERLGVSHLLDTRIAHELRCFSRAHQRQETFKALQMQARALPEMVLGLQSMIEHMERHNRQLSESLLANQDRHHQETRAIHQDLAASVDASLRQALLESARMAGETIIRPAVEGSMSAIAREAEAAHARLAGLVETQLDGVAGRFHAAVATVSDTWTRALSRHEEASLTLNRDVREALTAHSDSFAERSAALLGTVERAHTGLQTDLARTVDALTGGTRALHERLGLETREALGATVSHFQQTASGLLESVTAAHSTLQTSSSANEAQRLAAFTGQIEAMSQALIQEWRQAGELSEIRQQQMCAAVEATAREMGVNARAMTTQTLDEVAQLMQTAAEAPKAAAEVIVQLRQELSASMARDNTLLEERSRIMATLAALLDAINHASSEQRGAIDALVAASADLLERAGARFEERISAESERINDAAARISSGAVEVSSLSEAFGLAVQLFSDSNDRLMDALQRIEGALAASMTRSDEQLAYYVAQAREVIDLSIMSQKQVVENLQGLAGRQAVLVDET